MEKNIPTYIIKGKKIKKNKNFWGTYLLGSKSTETPNKVSILFGLNIDTL